MGCGGTASENLTYFESNSQNTFGACNAKVCKCNTKVCQLRLDFLTFVISGPSTSTISISKAAGGVVTHSTGTISNEYGQCLTDSFGVTSVGNRGTPMICGTNTGYHMYVDASNDCNTLSFHIADGTSSVNRQWEIRVTQYNCDSIMRAPEGCLQYFADVSGSGVLESFNHANKIHLANQDQLMCIRREEGMCKICYAAASDADFGLSDPTMPVTNAAAKGLVGKASMCCNTAMLAMPAKDYDCFIIASPSKKADGALLAMANGNFCGGKLVSDTAMDTAQATVCSKVTPFQVRFLSNSDEDGAAEVVNNGNTGFKVAYEQVRC
jgi:hypothetical protein